MSEPPSRARQAGTLRQPQDPNRGAGTPPPNPPLLHRMLGAGLVVVALAFLGLPFVGLATIRPVDTITPFLEYGFAGVTLVLIAVAFLRFKPRVPSRDTGQSLEEYWVRPEVGGAVALVWFLLEGAGLIAAVGYFLTGDPLSAIVMVLAIVTFWLCGPSQFANG
jgi:hypothetical protein